MQALRTFVYRAYRYVHHTAVAAARFGADRQRVLLILGHMRSGSSLLVHILNSNPAVAGYGETHLHYTSARSNVDLRYDVYARFRENNEAPPQGGRGPSQARYVMDKVLHPHVHHAGVLAHPAVKTIFLARRPEASLPSIHRPGDPHFISTEPEALDYYEGRLRRMVRYARALDDPARSFFLTYRQLLHQTDDVLGALAAFLSLEHPLTERYETTWATGQPIIGDPSEAIRAGRIVRGGGRAAEQRDRSFTPARLERARAAYDESVAALAHHCAGRRPLAP